MDPTARPPMGPAAAGSGAARAQTPAGGTPGTSAGRGGPPAPQMGQAAAGAGQTGTGPTKAGQPQAGSTFPAAKPAPGPARPTTGVPPWEITDSFLAVPAPGAEAAGSADRTAPAGPAPSAAAAPSIPGRDAVPADPGDSTENFPAVDPAAQPSFPRSDPGDSTETFPVPRLRADAEDAFRLFPPVRGTDARPPADGRD